MVLSPILDKRVISVRDDIPFTSETKINGTAMSFNSLKKIVPQGLIQPVVNFSKPTHTERRPRRIPRPIPINIFAQRGNFRIMNFILH